MNEIKIKINESYLENLHSSALKVLSKTLDKVLGNFSESNYLIGKRIHEAYKIGIDYRKFNTYEDFKAYIEDINLEIKKDLTDGRIYELEGVKYKKQILDLSSGVEIPERLLIRLGEWNVNVEKINPKNLGNIVNLYNLNNDKIEKFENNKLIGIEKENIELGLKETVNLTLNEKNKIDSIYDFYNQNSDNESIFS